MGTQKFYVKYIFLQAHARFSAVVERCPVFSIAHTTLHIRSATIGTTIDYSCIDNYIDSGRQQSNATITCARNLRWTGLLLHCTGKIEQTKQNRKQTVHVQL